MWRAHNLNHLYSFPSSLMFSSEINHISVTLHILNTLLNISTFVNNFDELLFSKIMCLPQRRLSWEWDMSRAGRKCGMHLSAGFCRRWPSLCETMWRKQWRMPPVCCLQRIGNLFLFTSWMKYIDFRKEASVLISTQYTWTSQGFKKYAGWTKWSISKNIEISMRTLLKCYFHHISSIVKWLKYCPPKNDVKPESIN